MKRKRWLTLFIPAENGHLVKDVGMIPYVLYKEHRYDATLASYRNGEYPYLTGEVNGLKQLFVRRIAGSPLIDGIIFLLFNACRFDILHVELLTRNNLVFLFVFKLFTFFRGKTYLKLDADEGYFQFDIRRVKWITRFLVKRVDVISVENTALQKHLEERWQRPIHYIPNGFYDHGQVKKTGPKRNKIMTCGRIGTRQKASEVLCEAFAAVAEDHPQWVLELAGPVEAGFERYMETYFSRYPGLRERVNLLGAVESRVRLAELYREAKILVLTSRFEGFPLVLPEAQECGCYIVSTDIQPAPDVIGDGRYGEVFAVDDERALARILSRLAGDPERLDALPGEIQQFAYRNFYWPLICGRLDALFQAHSQAYENHGIR